ncbi:hypothetical protein H5410_005381 [Solanum commersonii]|uniref:Uncharacterized protein n=1 Tax=Solanum commersonii TaxID=4109 RepID=A0A9J6A7A4_SOLCO|nr:hypothetical protein H5410_005381 [Solanum commersonii]
MVNIEICFNYEGEWIQEPFILYKKKSYFWRGFNSDLLCFIDIVNEYTIRFEFVGIQQLIVTDSSGRYYEVERDIGIRQLLSLVYEEFLFYFIINAFVVKECGVYVSIPNIVQYVESFFSIVTKVGTDYSESESEVMHDTSEYDSEELEAIAIKKKRELELYKGMSFKDIPEARQCIRLYGLAKKIKDANTPSVRILTLNDQLTCWPTFDNPVLDAIQEKYKRAKRMALKAFECGFTESFRMAMKMSFKEGLRPYIGLDGTFLKGDQKNLELVLGAISTCIETPKWRRPNLYVRCAEELEGIPCPYTIKDLLHRKIDPLTEMNWYQNKEIYLLTYKHKLQPVMGENYIKIIDPYQAMEPPEVVKLSET